MGKFTDGQLKMDQKDWEGAIKDFTDALVEPGVNKLMVYSKRGDAKKYLEELEGAADDYTQCVLIAPQFIKQYSSIIEDRIMGSRVFERLIKLEDLKNAAILREHGVRLLRNLDVYNRFLKTHPNSEIILTWRSEDNELAGNNVADVIQYTRQIDNAERNVLMAYSTRGDIKKAKKNLSGAAEDYAQCVVQYPQYINHYVSIINDKEMGSLVLQLLLIGKDIENIRILRKHGVRLLNNLVVYREWLRAESSNKHVWFWYASDSLALGKHDQAIAAYSALINLADPEYLLQAYQKRAEIKKLKNDIINAAEDYAECIKLDPANIDWYYDAAIGSFVLEALIRKKDLDNARKLREKGILAKNIEVYDSWLRAELNNKYVWFWYASDSLALGKHDQTIAAYSALIKLADPEYLLQAYQNRAEIKKLKNDIISSAEDYAECIKLDPANITKYYDAESGSLVLEALIRKKDLCNARKLREKGILVKNIEVYEEFLKTSPNNREILIWKGEDQPKVERTAKELVLKSALEDLKFQWETTDVQTIFLKYNILKEDYPRSYEVYYDCASLCLTACAQSKIAIQQQSLLEKSKSDLLMVIRLNPMHSDAAILLERVTAKLAGMLEQNATVRVHNAAAPQAQQAAGAAMQQRPARATP